MEVVNELVTQNYTKVLCEEPSEQKFNAPHHFTVTNVNNGEIVGIVDFQEGPIKECGINGVNNEDLLLMVLTRLEAFQSTKYACEENEIAIMHIQETLKVLRERTNKRVERNVEGTSEV